VCLTSPNLIRYLCDVNMYTSERLSEVKNSVFLGFVNCKNALIIDNFDLFMLCERPTLFKLRIHTHYYALK